MTLSQHQRSLTRRSLVLGGASLATWLGLMPSVALAEPSSADLQAELDTARAQLSSMGDGLAAMQQQLMDAEHAIESTRAQIRETEEKISETTDELNSRRADLSSLMSSSYKSGDNALAALGYILGATSAEDLVSRVYYMDKVSEQQADAIASVKQLGEELQQQRTDLEAQQADQEATIESTTASVEEYQAQVASAQSYLESLDSQVQEALAREAAEAAESEAASSVSTAIQAVEQNKVIEQNQQTSGGTSGGSSDAGTSGGSTGGGTVTPTPDPEPTTPDPTPTPTPTPTPEPDPEPTPTPGGGASDSSVIGYAQALIGKPYKQWWTGTNYGPGADGYDCCGLVATAYHMAGYSLPYATDVPGLMSYVQGRGNWKSCNLSNYQSVLNPGDLIFCSTGHVALYIGGNQMIHANYPGGSVCQAAVYACIGGGFGG